MRNVMLIAAILSIMPGFVCGMEKEREEDEEDVNPLFLLVQAIKEEDKYQNSSSLQPPKVNYMKIPVQVLKSIKEDVKNRSKKTSSALMEAGLCPNKNCADACGACESIGCGGCVSESIEWYERYPNCENGCFPASCLGAGWLVGSFLAATHLSPCCCCLCNTITYKIIGEALFRDRESSEPHL